MTVGYGATLALCGTCRLPLKKAPAWDVDVELYERCPAHFAADMIYVPVTACFEIEQQPKKETRVNVYGTVYAGGKEVGVVNEDFQIVQQMPKPTVSIHALWRNRFGQKMYRILINNKKELAVTFDELKAIQEVMTELPDRVPCECKRFYPMAFPNCPHCYGRGNVKIAP